MDAIGRFKLAVASQVDGCSVLAQPLDLVLITDRTPGRLGSRNAILDATQTYEKNGHIEPISCAVLQNLG